MSRWHLPSCDSPGISTRSGKPYCSACNSTPSDSLLGLTGASEQTTSPCLPTPPNEPLGKLNLRWPPTVNYSNRDNADDKPDTSAVGPVLQDPADLNAHPANSIIYPRKLRQDEFRLLYLSPQSSFDGAAALHLDLVTYSDDDYPDYEAVSYTWGDETGDSTPCVPVYFGPYWDVFLQTRNCASMLRYTRRPENTRVLWVDAICMNQLDAEEKAIQIPKMTFIYKRCLRVVVYLGEEAAGGPRVDGHFPARRNLSDLSADSFNQMLGLRYFSRLWVIQELILARQVVFVYQGTEYEAETISVSRLESFLKASSTPWLSLLGRQRLESNGGLRGILDLTGRAMCADMRDKIFGILGLVGQKENDPLHLLRPDYSLSALHLFTGVFAHCVLRESDTKRVLLNSIGIKGWGTQPSWVPDWTTTDGLSLPLSEDEHNMNQFTQDYRVWEVAKSIQLGDNWTLRRVVWRAGVYAGYSAFREPELVFRQAGRGGFIDASTGSLSLHMVHFCPLQSRLTSFKKGVLDIDGREVHVFSSGMNEWKLFLVAFDNRLAEFTDPEVDHIFYAEAGTALLVRKLDHSTKEGHYRIIAPLHSIYVAEQFQRPTENSDTLEVTTLVEFHTIISLRSQPPSFSSERELVDNYLECHDPIARQRRDTRTAKRLRHQLFPGAKTAEDTLPLVHSLLAHVSLHGMNHRKSSWLRSIEVYFYSVNSEFQGSSAPWQRNSPVAEQPEHLVLTFPPSSFGYVKEWYCSPVYTPAEDPDGSLRRSEENLFGLKLPGWEWERSQGDWVPLPHAPDASQPVSKFAQHLEAKSESSEKVKLRVLGWDMVDYIVKYSWEFDVLKRFYPYGLSGSTGYAEELKGLYKMTDKRSSSFFDKMLRRSVFAWPSKPQGWPTDVLRHLKIDGVPQFVTIL